MNTLRIFKQADAQSSAAEAGEHLNESLTHYRKQPLLLMLSAGSALNILEFVGQSALGENLTVSVLDERFSQDPNINNFHQLQKLDFYNLALEAGVSFFGTLPRHNETMEELAQRWETNLRNWRQQNPMGLIIATLGLGADGHTAGIFPNADEKRFNDKFLGDPWTVAYDVGKQHEFSQRITTTLTFLKTVDVGFAFVCGAEKKPKLEAVLAKQGKVSSLPALAWHEIKELGIFTDIEGY